MSDECRKAFEDGKKRVDTLGLYLKRDKHGYLERDTDIEWWAFVDGWSARGDGWVRVKERLPEIGIPVILRLETKWGREHLGVFYHQAEECDSWYWENDLGGIAPGEMTPTHWHPIPGREEEQ